MNLRFASIVTFLLALGPVARAQAAQPSGMPVATVPWMVAPATVPAAQEAVRLTFRLSRRGVAPVQLAMAASPALQQGSVQLVSGPQSTTLWRYALQGSAAQVQPGAASGAAPLPDGAVAANLFGTAFSLRDLLGLDLRDGAYTASPTFAGQHGGADVLGYILQPAAGAAAPAHWRRIEVLVDARDHSVRALRYMAADGVISRRLTCSPAPLGQQGGSCTLSDESGRVQRLVWQRRLQPPTSRARSFARGHLHAHRPTRLVASKA